MLSSRIYKESKNILDTIPVILEIYKGKLKKTKKNVYKRWPKIKLNDPRENTMNIFGLLYQTQNKHHPLELRNTATASLQSSNISNNECPRYDTKQSDGVVSVVLKVLRMQHTPSVPSLPGPLWPGVVAPDRVLSMDLIELYCELMLN